jgi:hypothetical protein
MNKELEALNRLKTINLDIVLDKLGGDIACDVSIYGIHDFPTLEMSGDLQTLEKAIMSQAKEENKNIVDSQSIEEAIDNTCKLLSTWVRRDVVFSAGKFYYQYFLEPHCTEAICYQLGENIIINYSMPAQLIIVIGNFYKKFFEYLGDMSDETCSS